jgi:hypothetical protein
MQQVLEVAHERYAAAPNESIVSGKLSDVTEVPTVSQFKQDATLCLKCSCHSQAFCEQPPWRQINQLLKEYILQQCETQGSDFYSCEQDEY